MASIIAVGIITGAEKLGRKIGEKRIERKEKKAATVSFTSHFHMYLAEL
jgi:phosphate/sulfate permease